MSAVAFVEALVDSGSFVSWDESIPPPDDPAVAAAVARASEKSGVDEAVITGQAEILGHRVALLVGEFNFLGGSIGRRTADRIRAAVRRASRENLPLIAAPASGGTRMHEGTPAFVTMPALAQVVEEHKAKGLLYLVYLRNPTTGGVLASWGSQGHITLAEPGALIGFLGPSVYRALKGEPFPSDVQTAENLSRCGIIDRTVAVADLAPVVGRILRVTGSSSWCTAAFSEATALPPLGRDADAWMSVHISHEDGRPGIRDVLHRAAIDLVWLSGTGAGERSDVVIGGLARFAGVPVVVMGQDRAMESQHGPLGPGDLRFARRLVDLAEALQLPLVSFVDTSGGDLSVAAEEGAMAAEISRLIVAVIGLRVPSVSVLLGQGCGGAALAFLPARRVVVAEHAWLSPLPLAGASTIMYGSPDHAAELARRQRIRSIDLLEDGFASVVVPEPSPAHLEPAVFCDRIAATVRHQLALQEQELSRAS